MESSQLTPRYDQTAINTGSRELCYSTFDLVDIAYVDPIVEWEEIAITGLLSGSFDLERQHPAYGMHRSSNPGFPPPTAKTMRPAFYLEDENGKATVTAKCREYLDYLEKMVREFQAAHT
jgi:hypothetical protein